MGIEDRGYYRDETPAGLTPSWNTRSAIATIIIINVVVFISNAIFSSRTVSINELLLLPADMFPAEIWRLYSVLTYGFVHAPSSLGHIFFNMFGLWMLGRAVEERYGKVEFYRIYLITVLVCGLGWFVLHYGENSKLLGASGAVCCIQMLFIYNYPRVQLNVWGVLPMPAWLLGIILVVTNCGFGQTFARQDSGIAFDVHLMGVAFATVYYFLGLNFRWLLLPKLSKADWARRRNVRLHKASASEANDSQEADRILEKIHESGKESLTSKERKFLEKYSRRVRNKRSES